MFTPLTSCSGSTNTNANNNNNVNANDALFCNTYTNDAGNTYTARTNGASAAAVPQDRLIK
jgi:hypothetical protein